MLIKEDIYTPTTQRLLIYVYADQYAWSQFKKAVVPPTCVSLWWSSSLWLCLIKTLGLHSHALLYGHASVVQIRGLLCISQPVEEEGSSIRESSWQAAVSSASPCVSRFPWSFQPAPQQPQSQRTGREVLRGLKQTWNSEQSTTSYMSDCNQWTCYS